MGCGCKNKANQQAQQQSQQASATPQQGGGSAAPQKTSVQENVKKVISKYYRR
jgi:hypothetical protein